MLYDTCLTAKFLLTNPTGQAFNLAWKFFSHKRRHTGPFAKVTCCCFLKVFFLLRRLSYCFCFKDSSRMCLFSCPLQFDDWLKLLLQCLHVYGFTPVWVRSCFLQSDELLKHLLQCLHVYIRLHSCMSSFMSPAMWWISEAVATMLACIRLLSCMLVHVSCNLKRT